MIERGDARAQRLVRHGRPGRERLDARLGLLRRRDDDEAIGIGIRQRTPEHAVGDGEDRGVEADAERERGEGGDGERRIAPHQSQRVTHVLRERFDRREDPRFARLFAQPQRIANPPPRGRPRLVAAHAIRVGEGVRLHLLVKAQLVFQIPIELIPPEEEQQTSEHRTHGTLLRVRTYVVFITRMIAPNIWENRDSSTPSCFFPAVVSV